MNDVQIYFAHRFFNIKIKYLQLTTQWVIDILPIITYNIIAYLYSKKKI
jgi:hypothetical protein